jgi:hypothetical protein
MDQGEKGQGWPTLLHARIAHRKLHRAPSQPVPGRGCFASMAPLILIAIAAVVMLTRCGGR